MTLSRQLVMLMVLLFILIIIGAVLIGIQNMRAFSESQLLSHAENTAASLGLSISTHLTEGDIASVASMTDAIFDRGLYHRIRVEDTTGNPVVERSVPITTEGVPDWFIRAISLDTLEGQATMMSGNRHVGYVKVHTQPGFAYTRLWLNLSKTFWWYLLLTLIALSLSILLLRLILRPLKKLEWQAQSISNRELPVVDKLPRTTDLRRIVEAINQMSQKVKRMLLELEQLASGLRKQAYANPVTGLSNKRHFMDTLQHLISTPEEFSHGMLCLLQLKNLKQYNDTKGYLTGDELLIDTANGMKAITNDLPSYHLAHLAGADFALIVQNCSIEEGQMIGERLSGVLAGLYATGKLDDPDAGHIGIAYFDGSQDLKQLLSEADMALRSARTSKANGWYLFTPEKVGKAHVMGASDWRSYIENALERDRIQLQYQPVVSCPDKRLLHQEVLVRIADSTKEGKPTLLSAGLFMPQAESSGLTADIDWVVVTKVLEMLMLDPDGKTRYALNLSPTSLHTPAFVTWLEEQVRAKASVARRIIFELPEYSAVVEMERLQALMTKLEPYGIQFSLDHFGRGFNSFAYLRSFKAHYLKVDGSFIRSLDKNRDNRFFVHALAEVAHGLDIQVIAESIETEEVWNLLPTLHIDGAQGYYVGKPRSLSG